MDAKSIKEIFETTDEKIKDLSNLELTQSDIEWIKNELNRYPHVHGIKWKENEPIFEQNKEIKVEIDKNLIENIIKSNQLVIDLSRFELGNFENDLLFNFISKKYLYFYFE